MQQRRLLWKMLTRDTLGPRVQEDDEVWVTVYGFQPSQRHLIMKEFAKCGDILKFGDGREDGANWVHIQYSVSPSTSWLTCFYHNEAK